jgi:hypothetical protein
MAKSLFPFWLMKTWLVISLVLMLLPELILGMLGIKELKEVSDD